MMRYLCVASFVAAAVFPQSVSGQSLGYRAEDCNRYMVQRDLNMCAARNFEAADDALNRAYSDVIGGMRDPEGRRRLIEEERAWIAERDRRCNAEAGPREQGGSIWPLNFAMCQERETRARIGELERYRR